MEFPASTAHKKLRSEPKTISVSVNAMDEGGKIQPVNYREKEKHRYLEVNVYILAIRAKLHMLALVMSSPVRISTYLVHSDCHLRKAILEH